MPTRCSAEGRPGRGAVAALLAVLAAVGAAASPRVSIPDTAETRQALREVIFAPIAAVLRAADRTVTQRTDGLAVRFRVERANGAVYLSFTRADRGPVRLDAAGTFVIKRDAADGSFLQAKIFLQDDPGCYARLTPRGDRTALQIVLFGRTLQRDVSIAARFETLLAAPLERIMGLAGAPVDWDLLQPAAPTGADAAVERVAGAIRAALPRLGDAEDGAMDAAATMVFIRDGSPQGAAPGLNCSGFAKWVVDGFYGPLTGALTDIARLKERDIGVRGNRWTVPLEDSRDPFFGLDWTRHLARELCRARGEAFDGVEAADVRDVAGFTYVDDVGYAVADLPVVLYRLVRATPGRIYLGSVNRPSPGGSALRLHDHVVVLLPYVDAARVFRVVVAERSVETTLGSLERRYPNDFVHLVRFDAAGDFVPPVPMPRRP